MFDKNQTKEYEDTYTHGQGTDRIDYPSERCFSHNFKNLVHCGDTVKAGQPIALTGRTGRASTEHLHFETRVNGFFIEGREAAVSRRVEIFDRDQRRRQPDRIPGICQSVRRRWGNKGKGCQNRD